MNPDYIRVDLCSFCEREAAPDSDYCDHHMWLWFGQDNHGNEIRNDVHPCNHDTELADLKHMSLAELILGRELADGCHDILGITVLHPAHWPTFSFPSPLPSYYPTTER